MGKVRETFARGGRPILHQTGRKVFRAKATRGGGLESFVEGFVDESISVRESVGDAADVRRCAVRSGWGAAGRVAAWAAGGVVSGGVHATAAVAI